jgi:hypothetical protein
MEAEVVISPKMITTPVLHIVSQATREDGSRVKQASTTASEMVSHSLSGWDSVTPSDVKRKEGASDGEAGLAAVDGDGGASVMVASTPVFGDSDREAAGVSAVSAVDIVELKLMGAG